MKTGEKKVPLASELVREFVAKAHFDFGRVQELLKQEPALLNAAWDWGNGDWETALGAASHTGNREIALFLVEQGARMDIFAAAMLGQVEVVRAMTDANPSLMMARGPHGIPLLAHAMIGGEPAKPVVEFLHQFFPVIDESL